MSYENYIFNIDEEYQWYDTDCDECGDETVQCTHTLEGDVCRKCLEN